MSKPEISWRYFGSNRPFSSIAVRFHRRLWINTQKKWEFWKTKIEEDALRVIVPWNGIRVLRWGIERYQVLVHGNELRAIFRLRNFGKEQKQSEESNHSFFSRQLFLWGAKLWMGWAWMSISSWIGPSKAWPD